MSKLAPKVVKLSYLNYSIDKIFFSEFNSYKIIHNL